ncbi:XdhC family protein [Flavicella sediminum]|uniref:XdhC family protein n=1 Tax=Flavicella sediminum TaxID=2585141 RepID=UPI001121A16E|nr:XdhC/CoxI family protein [Flavicella sediminum]
MTHEFKHIIEAYTIANQAGIKTVLATVVSVDGSSYRGAGVRMLVLENKQIVGAISGGCVEKEVIRQAQTVFKTGNSKLMTYDGRFRLGCEGTLFVLLEVFSPKKEVIDSIKKSIDARHAFEISTFYNKDTAHIQCGSIISFSRKEDFYSFSSKEGLINERTSFLEFKEKLLPCFRLIIIGTEHDAVSLCTQASCLGWEVWIVAASDSRKEKQNFPGASHLVKVSADDFSIEGIDKQTAFVLMNHNYAKDVLYLKALKNTEPMYIGLLGPSKRKEQMLSSFIEYHFDVTDAFLESIYGPAGLNIGGETPQEIAISIISEIIAVSQGKKAYHLQDKKGSIHDRDLKSVKFFNEK